MKKSLIALAVALACGMSRAAFTKDVAITYRMGAGYAGDVNRTHPASIVPGMIDGTDTVRLIGDPAIRVAASGTWRGIKAADQSDATAVSIAGVLTRPYPFSQTTGGMAQSLGAAGAPMSGVPQDFLDEGFILVKCNNFGTNAPTPGAAVYVWCTASAGNHVQGGFEAALDAGDTVKVLNAEWHSPADSNGIAEMRVWKQRA